MQTHRRTREGAGMGQHHPLLQHRRPCHGQSGSGILFWQECSFGGHAAGL